MTLEFYTYDPYDAVIHNTADEAEAAATRRIGDFHSDAVKHGDWDEDVQLVEYGVVLPLGRATSHPTGAAPEAPAVNHRDYALAEVDVDAAEFWRELSERAPKLAAALDAAAPEARKHRLNVARAVGIYYSAEGHGDQPGPDERVLAAIRSLCSRRDHLEDALTEWRKRTPCIVRACSFVLDRAADDDDLAEAQELLDWVRGLEEGAIEAQPGHPPCAPQTTPMRTFSWTDGAFSRSRALAVDSSGNPLVTDQGYTLVAGPPIEQVRKGGG